METQTNFLGEKTETTLWQSLCSQVRSQSNLVTVDVDPDADGCTGLVDGCTGLVDGCAGLVDGCAGLVDGCTGLVDGCAGLVDGCARLVDGCAGLVDGCAGLGESVGVEDEVDFVILGDVTAVQVMLHDIMTGWVY